MRFLRVQHFSIPLCRFPFYREADFYFRARLVINIAGFDAYRRPSNSPGDHT